MIGSLDTCTLLIEAGAEWDVKDKLGRRPVDLAKEFGFVDIMTYLDNLSNTQ